MERGGCLVRSLYYEHIGNEDQLFLATVKVISFYFFLNILRRLGPQLSNSIGTSVLAIPAAVEEESQNS
jgi:hypothetical protein